jgi:hypothetical protein
MSCWPLSEESRIYSVADRLVEDRLQPSRNPRNRVFGSIAMGFLVISVIVESDRTAECGPAESLGDPLRHAVRIPLLVAFVVVDGRHTDGPERHVIRNGSGFGQSTARLARGRSSTRARPLTVLRQRTPIGLVATCLSNRVGFAKHAQIRSRQFWRSSPRRHRGVAAAPTESGSRDAMMVLDGCETAPRQCSASPAEERAAELPEPSVPIDRCLKPDTSCLILCLKITVSSPRWAKGDCHNYL